MNANPTATFSRFPDQVLHSGHLGRSKGETLFKKNGEWNLKMSWETPDYQSCQAQLCQAMLLGTFGKCFEERVDCQAQLPLAVALVKEKGSAGFNSIKRAEAPLDHSNFPLHFGAAIWASRRKNISFGGWGEICHPLILCRQALSSFGEGRKFAANFLRLPQLWMKLLNLGVRGVPCHMVPVWDLSYFFWLP